MATKSHFLLLLFLFNSVISFACTCSYENSIKSAVNSADIVLTGRIISKKQVNVDYNFSFLVPEYVYLVQINHIYKGKTTTKKIKIRSGSGGGDCGFPFKKFKRYIIYGYESEIDLVKNPNLNNVGWITNICTRPKSFNKLELSELNELAKGNHVY